MKRPDIRYKYIKVLPVVIIFILAGCSYSMDKMEAMIMDRASFSIKAEYDSIGKVVKFTWSTTGSSSEDDRGNPRFAGYELFMTSEPYDEYADYMVIAASENINGDYDFFVRDSKLNNNDVTSFEYDFGGNFSILPKGVYFFRLCIVDHNSYSKDSDGDGDDEKFYYTTYDETNMDKMSGQVKVEIY